MKPLGVLVSGHGSNLQAILDACAQGEIAGRVACVISSNPAAFAGNRAQKAGVPYHILPKMTPEARDEHITRLLRNHDVQGVCLAGYMRLLTPNFVETWWDRLLNIHPSLLPSFKGLHAQRQALMAGVKVTGCTVHFVRPAMDEGPIVLQATTPVFEDDTEDSLSQRIHTLEHRIYVQALRWYCKDRLIIRDERVFLRPENGLAL
ncbi:MAG: phosphoribosylglycinamide formyltransferase [Alphaproteobacteria bacterium]